MNVLGIYMHVEDLEVQFKLPSNFFKKRLIEKYSPGYLFHTLAFFMKGGFFPSFVAFSVDSLSAFCESRTAGGATA